MKELYKIFPLIAKKVSYPDHQELKQYISENVLENEDVPKTSNKSGTISLFQTFDDKSFFRDVDAPVIKRFEDFCRSEILTYAREDMAYDMEDIIIVGSWVNVYGASGQDLHSHANSFFSANYFLNYDESQGHKPLVIWSPYKTMNPSRPYIAHDRLKTSIKADHYDFIALRANEGDLFIFPSQLTHSVAANPSNATRKTISMNAMPTKLRMHSYSFEVKKG